MEANGMSARMLSGIPSGILGLEMPLHQQQQQQQFSHHHHQQQQPPHHQLSSYPTHDTQSQQSTKQNNYPFSTKAKQQQLSDEDEPGFNVDDAGCDGKRKISPWQRMKWTDNMVRLLIMVVFYIGDDCNMEANDSAGTVKKKASGILQKKGKWKSVSRAMMEKGFYVSPQQCEDKFNDLNKRYKRVNDILGKGIACRVVENQSLLDTMDHLSPKLKDEVRKLLNSKHLFFREMCAYHNSGGGSTSNGGGHQSSEAVMESTHHQQQQHCFHLTENGTPGANSRMEMDGVKNASRGSRDIVDVDEEEDDGDDNDNNEDENEDEEETEGGSCGVRSHETNCDDNEMVSNKRQRREIFTVPLMKQMSAELVSMLQDGTKTPWEQRQWLMNRTLQLEEQKVSYQCQAFELEKQRLKWMKFSAKKEREMERMKLENERVRLENERMVLLLRKKELDLIHHHQQLQQQQQQQQQSSNRRSDPSSMAG